MGQNANERRELMAQGRLAARLAHLNGRTRLIECDQGAPLKIARTFEAAEGGLEICIMDASPGLLSGDEYRFDWRVEERARVRVTTQGATRIHPARGEGSRQITQIHVGANARLELWPESIIPFVDAHLTAKTEAFLEAGAHLTLFESLSAGRVARGEKFTFEAVDSQVTVRDANGPLLHSRNSFIPAEFSPQNLASWGEAMQWSCLYLFGDFANPVIPLARQVLSTHGVRGSVSQLARGGFAVVMLGQRAHDLRCVALEIEAAIKKI